MTDPVKVRSIMEALFWVLYYVGIVSIIYGIYTMDRKKNSLDAVGLACVCLGGLLGGASGLVIIGLAHAR